MRSERVRLDRPPALVVGGRDDAWRRARSIARSLVCGRGVHHHHRARHAGAARGERHALRGVAGADRPHAVAQLRPAAAADGVPGAANLERADRLQRLELQEDLRRRRSRRERQVEADERRADRGLVDVLRRRP